MLVTASPSKSTAGVYEEMGRTRDEMSVHHAYTIACNDNSMLALLNSSDVAWLVEDDHEH